MTTYATPIMPAKKASFWKRLIACLIDNVTIGTAVFLISRLFGIVLVVEDLLVFVLFYGYGTIVEHYRQMTLGKSIMKLKVIGIDGKPPTMLASFYRNFGKIVSTLPLFYGFIRVLAPHQGQAIHDELARCFVIDVAKVKAE